MARIEWYYVTKPGQMPEIPTLPQPGAPAEEELAQLDATATVTARKLGLGEEYESAQGLLDLLAIVAHRSPNMLRNLIKDHNCDAVRGDWRTRPERI